MIPFELPYLWRNHCKHYTLEPAHVSSISSTVGCNREREGETDRESKRVCQTQRKNEKSDIGTAGEKRERGKQYKKELWKPQKTIYCFTDLI